MGVRRTPRSPQQRSRARNRRTPRSPQQKVTRTVKHPRGGRRSRRPSLRRRLASRRRSTPRSPLDKAAFSRGTSSSVSFHFGNICFEKGNIKNKVFRLYFLAVFFY